MKRKRRTILFFALCASAVVGAMGWLTVQLLNLEKREAEARHIAAFQSRVRLAQVKMDRFLEELLTKEKSRAHYEYLSYYTPNEAYLKAWTAACRGDVVLESPLMSQPEPKFCKLHFQIAAGKSGLAITTPRLPQDLDTRNQALITGVLTQSDLSEAITRLETFKVLTTPEELVARAPDLHAEDGSTETVVGSPSVNPRHFAGLLQQDAVQSYGAHPNARFLSNTQVLSTQRGNRSPTNPDAVDVTVSVLRPVWLHPESTSPQLVLLRSVELEGAKGEESLVQGVWLDWPALRSELLSSVAKQLPGADLVPEGEQGDDPGKLLSIPAILVARAPAVTIDAGLTPTRATLYVAWAGVLAALCAVALVVRAILDIGERRGRFVSAVTHELRTPLTTFCLYSEMLADDMVRDEKSRRDYLSTLKRESQRLAKIVENVLCYARLSEVRASVNTQRVDAGELLDRILPGLTHRTVEAGMQIVPDLDAARGVALDVDPQTVERILTNLVDNACKYAKGHAPAGGAEDNRIHLSAVARPGTLEIRVADHGPGIPRHQRRAIFKPFNRAHAAVAPNAPGLGLGLSLARGLARELGGELQLVPLPSDFACGTVMSLCLPAQPSSELQVVSTAPSPA